MCDTETTASLSTEGARSIRASIRPNLFVPVVDPSSRTAKIPSTGSSCGGDITYGLSPLGPGAN
jgi:hypothetical protein